MWGAIAVSCAVVGTKPRPPPPHPPTPRKHTHTHMHTPAYTTTEAQIAQPRRASRARSTPAAA